jgi:hypothetical protein
LVDVPDTSVTALTLRLHLQELLQGRVSLPDFEDWFIDSTWDETHISLDALELARKIELLIAEYTSGAWTWSELRSQMSDLTHEATVTWGAGAAVSRITSGSTGSVIRELVLALPSAVANIRFVEVRA